MARAFTLPDLGEGVHEAEIQEVIVSQGASVEEGDPVLVVETDKAAVEVPSPYTGTIAEIRVTVGDIVQVGDVLITFDGEEAAAAAAPRKSPSRQRPAPLPNVLPDPFRPPPLRGVWRANWRWTFSACRRADRRGG